MIAEVILSAVALFIIWIIIKSSRKRKKNRQQQHRDLMYKTGNYAEYIRLMEGIPFRHQADCQALAHANFEVGNVEQGRILFRKAFTMSGADHYSIRQNFGKCEYNKGNYVEAIKMFQEIDPEDVAIDAKYQQYEVPLLLGISFMKIGKHELAIEAFKKAPVGKRNADSGITEIVGYMGECYEALGNTKMAIKHYNKVLAQSYDDELSKKIDTLEASLIKK